MQQKHSHLLYNNHYASYTGWFIDYRAYCSPRLSESAARRAPTPWRRWWRPSTSLCSRENSPTPIWTNSTRPTCRICRRKGANKPTRPRTSKGIVCGVDSQPFVAPNEEEGTGRTNRNGTCALLASVWPVVSVSVSLIENYMIVLGQ